MLYYCHIYVCFIDISILQAFVNLSAIRRLLRLAFASDRNRNQILTSPEDLPKRIPCRRCDGRTEGECDYLCLIGCPWWITDMT